MVLINRRLLSNRWHKEFEDIAASAERLRLDAEHFELAPPKLAQMDDVAADIEVNLHNDSDHRLNLHNDRNHTVRRALHQDSFSAINPAINPAMN